MDVTDEAIETHDLLHFDVLNESNVRDIIWLKNFDPD